MFGFFKKQEPPGRKELRLEFEQVNRTIRNADNLAQIAVGHAINMANSMFIQRFKSIDEFKRFSKTDKIVYIKSLTQFEEKMSREDPYTAVGFTLFKMWIGALSENDDELVGHFSKGLSHFSQKGELCEK